MAETIASPPVATRPERCSNCNAKLPDTPVSLCPYCAMPILGAPAPAGGAGTSPNAARIARVRAHEDFPAAMAWSPPEGPRYRQGSWMIYCGRVALGLGVVLLSLGALLAGGAPFSHGAGWLGLAAALAGTTWIVRGRLAKLRSVASPLLKRPGIVLDRRSETNLRGWGGATTYFFTIELEGGIQGEFAYPGRGANEEPYVNNLPGVAYTRGADLLAFRHVRV